MEENPLYSLVSTIPVMTSLYKERLYDYMISQNMDPNDETLFPDPVYLRVRLYPYGTDDPLCEMCAVKALHEKGVGETHDYYAAQQRPGVPSPLSCTSCERHLAGTMQNRGSAKAVIEWSTRHLREGCKLQAADWYDIWSSLDCLDDDDPLWDHVGIIITKYL